MCAHEALKSCLEREAAEVEGAKQLVIQMQKRGQYLRPRLEAQDDAGREENEEEEEERLRKDDRLLRLEIQCLRLRLQDLESDRDTMERARRRRRRKDSIVAEACSQSSSHCQQRSEVEEAVRRLEEDNVKLEEDVRNALANKRDARIRMEEEKARAKEANEDLLRLLKADKDADVDALLTSSVGSRKRLQRLSAERGREKSNSMRAKHDLGRAVTVAHHRAGGETPRRVMTCSDAQRTLVASSSCGSLGEKEDVAYLRGLATALLGNLQGKEREAELEASRAKTLGRRLSSVKSKVPKLWQLMEEEREEEEEDSRRKASGVQQGGRPADFAVDFQMAEAAAELDKSEVATSLSADRTV